MAAVDPKENRLLGALPDDDYQRWLPFLEDVELSLGQVLYESRTVLSHVYFPTTAIVSMLYVMANGASAVASCSCTHAGPRTPGEPWPR